MNKSHKSHCVNNKQQEYCLILFFHHLTEMFCIVQLLMAEFSPKKSEIAQTKETIQTIETLLEHDAQQQTMQTQLAQKMSILEEEMKTKNTDLSKEIEAVTLDLQTEFLSIREELAEVGEYYLVATQANEKSIEKLSQDIKQAQDFLQKRIDDEAIRAQDKETSILTDSVVQLETLRTEFAADMRQVEISVEAHLTKEMERAKAVENSLREVVAFVYQQSMESEEKLEKERLESEEKTKQINISIETEKSRALQAEKELSLQVMQMAADLKTEIAKYVEKGVSIEKQLEEKIADLLQKSRQLQYTVKLVLDKEIFRAKHAEQSLSSALAMEHNRAVKEEEKISKMASEANKVLIYQKEGFEEQISQMRSMGQEILKKLSNFIESEIQNRQELKTLQLEFDMLKRYYLERRDGQNMVANHNKDSSVFHNLSKFFARPL